MGRKLGGGACAFFLGELGPHLIQSRLGRDLYHTFTPSGILVHSRLATTDMGRKLGVVPLVERELGPHLTQYHLN